MREVAAFVFNLRRPRGFFGKNLEEGVLRRAIPSDAVKNKEFGFGAEERLITDTGGLQIGFGALGDRTGIAGVALTRIGFGDVAGHDERVLFAERIHVRRFRIRHEDHVARFDASPTGHRRAVKRLPVFKRIFRQLMHGHRHVLFAATGIRQTVVDVLHVVVFDHLQNVSGGRHNFSPQLEKTGWVLGIRIASQPSRAR